MRSSPFYSSMASKADGTKVLAPKVPTASEVASSSVVNASTVDASQAGGSSTTGVMSSAPASSTTAASSQGSVSIVSKLPSARPSVAAAAAASERSHSGSRSKSHSGRLPRPTYIIKPTIVGLPTNQSTGPPIPPHTFLSTSISLLLYLAVMIIIFSVDCPFDREVSQFFAFVLLAFAGSLFMLIINLTAVKYHRYNCVSTSLSLLYSGSAALVVYGLVDTSINGLCKPNKLFKGSVFKSGLLSNFFMWSMTALSVLWQLIAYYYYG